MLRWRFFRPVRYLGLFECVEFFLAQKSFMTGAVSDPGQHWYLPNHLSRDSLERLHLFRHLMDLYHTARSHMGSRFPIRPLCRYLRTAPGHTPMFPSLRLLSVHDESEYQILSDHLGAGNWLWARSWRYFYYLFGLRWAVVCQAARPCYGSYCCG